MEVYQGTTGSLPQPYDLLPQCYPFLLLDRLTFHSQGKIRALKCVSANEWFITTHRTGHLSMSSSLFIEIMAQAAAVLSRLDQSTGKAAVVAVPGKIAAVDKFRSFRQVNPDELLEVEAKLKFRVGKIAQYQCEIRSAQHLVAEGILALVSAEYV